MKQEPYKIIIVDDHPLFTDGLVRILENESDFIIDGICNNSTELFHMMNSKTPDLLLLDIQMGGTNGLEICSAIKKSNPQIKVILISMFKSAKVINDGRKAGANGYIPKTTDANVVKATIRDVIVGKKVFIKLGQSDTKTDFGEGNNVFLLSKREKEIIQLTKKGYTSKTIAGKISISQYTVETHRKNILRKLQLSSIKELISYAYENNL
ncbi:response regulator [Mariniflexile sp. HMF6888]|uniref:response regulator n=1 Tax=Mariniflexile sp. HMF6888 TaxID=3373086 RepID=UPI0037B62DA0